MNKHDLDTPEKESPDLAEKMPYNHDYLWKKTAPVEPTVSFNLDEARALHAVLHKGAQKGIYEISEYQAVFILNEKIESFLKNPSN